MIGTLNGFLGIAHVPRVATVHTESLPGLSKPARCQLVVIEGPDRGRAASLEGGEVVVGTDAECGLVLSDARVSQRHLAVRAEGERFLVRDLGSTNGTVYEGSLIQAMHVGPGATLKVGQSFLRVTPEPQAVEVPPSQARRFGELVAESLAMREVFAVLELAARGEVTVLLEGETGTGKELAARALHEAGPRRGEPLVAIDCSALPEALLESELFGHVKGAFTGAAANRTGAIARAHRGTLFLDELGSTTPALQARLLRVLEERRVRPVGADADRPVDIRVIAGSRDDLAARVAEGQFRSDLFFRLSVLKVVLPPLRSRREDLPVLMAELLRRRGLEPGPITGAALDTLTTHDWPGNVRELRNVVDRALALQPHARSFADLRLTVSPRAGGDEEALAVRTDLTFADAKELVNRSFELRYLRDVLARCQGNLSAAAREANLDRKHLRMLARRHGLVSDGEE